MTQPDPSQPPRRAIRGRFCATVFLGLSLALPARADVTEVVTAHVLPGCAAFREKAQARAAQMAPVG